MYNFELTYDAADGYVLLLGTPAGQYGYPAGPTTDLWKFSGGSWSPIYLATVPQNCPGSALAYDDADGYVVFLGGPNYRGSGLPPCRSANQTWSYHGGAWTHLTPAVSPAGRFGASFTNDTGDGYLLLFGGSSGYCGSYGYCGDTWKFKAGTWTPLTPKSSPSNRTEAGMAYDTADGYVLLFGGTNSTGNHNDSWSYHNGAWTQLHPTVSPPVPQPDAFAYDAADKVVVYTNAFNNFSGVAPQILWTYHADNWTQVTASGPLQRIGGGMTYDVRDGYMVFFGGYSGTNLRDTWSYKGGAWTNLTAPDPGIRTNAALAYDAADGYLVLFGGQGYNGALRGDTWTYAKGVWTNISPAQSPSARESAGMAYDAADGYLLLFGGDNRSGSLGDSWEFTAGAWTQVTPTRSPSNRTAGQMVYDGYDGYVLLFGGWPTNLYPDTWTYHAGSWTNRTGSLTQAPPAVATNPLVYDGLDQYVLLFGTYQTPGSQNTWTQTQNQSWTFAGGKWTNITGRSLLIPPAVNDASLAYDAANGVVLLFGGAPRLWTQWLGETWTYSQGNWTQQFPSASPDNRSNAASAWDGADSLVLLVGGLNNYGYPVQGTNCAPAVCDDSWAWQNGVGSRPFVRSFAAIPPAVDVGNSTGLTVVATAGAGPYSYAYFGLPGGCASANTSTLSCTPSAPGVFLVSVNVSDSAGNWTLATTGLRVNPIPSVSSFVATPSSITLGGRSILTATVSGGTLPESYNYSGLPPGCTTQTVPSLPCAPSSAGSYSVVVTVTDADNRSGSATVALVVHPAGAAGAPIVSAFGANPSAFVLGNSTNFTVNATSSTGALTYSFQGLPLGCASSNVSVLPCSPTAAGSYTTTVTVTDTLGNSTSVSTNVTVYPVGGGSGALITAFAAVPPVVNVGQSAAFLVSATGGTAPLSFGYTGLPEGCPTRDTASLVCTPLVAGPFRIVVTVEDSAGIQAQVGTDLSVDNVGGGPGTGGPLRVLSFAPSPPSVAVGGDTVLAVVVSGGSGNLTYQYSGLPVGCRTLDTPTLPCAPSTAGVFGVSVRVSDTTGASTTAGTVLTVTPGSANSTGVSTAWPGIPVAWATFALGLGAGALGAGLLAVYLLRRRPGR